MAIVTLTSDFGNKDYLVGAFKGRILQQHAQCNFVDISHEISPFNFAEAAYIIQNSVFHFPEHSYHLLLVNIYDSVTSLPLIGFHKGQFFGVPDNGLLPMVLGEKPEQLVALELAHEAQFNTLAWADLFGRAIAHIESGQPFHKLGTEMDTMVEKFTMQAAFGSDYIDGRIIFIDRFENVVVNITREQFFDVGKGRPFTIAFKSRDTIHKIVGGYPQAGEGSSLAFFNAAGYLEIAVNKGNAAGLFGLQTFSHLSNPEFIKSRMMYQMVRILFE